MTTATEYVIVLNYDHNPRFWNGMYWVAEYPDALVLDNEREAEKALRNAMRAGLHDCKASMVRSYGYEDEAVIRECP